MSVGMDTGTTLLTTVKHVVKAMTNVHRPDGRPNVFLFSTPRSGSTWLMELIWTQPGFKYCNEPLNLQDPFVRRYLGIDKWVDLYGPEADPRLRRYFDALCSGRLGFENPNPLRRPYRPITHRIVFKEIHGAMDRINWFRDTFNARILFLLRHPIAVALSREGFPAVHAFLRSHYGDRFTDQQLVYAERILASGTKLEQGVLAWCLQNVVPLRDAGDDWAVVSYEQMVLDPYPVIDRLVERLALPRPDRMRDRLTTPSGVKAKSTKETQQLLESRDAETRPRLVDKWRNLVDGADEARAMKALDIFGLDAYRCGDALPASWLWITPQPSVGSAHRPRDDGE